MSEKTVSIAVTGSGGSGAVTTGSILLEAMARAGFYGNLSRSAGPQIRGGESAAMLRFSTQPVYGQNDRYDVLLSFDWDKVERFIEEIPLDQQSLIIAENEAGDLPGQLAEFGAEFSALPFKKQAKLVENGRPNMVGLGVLSTLLGLSADYMLQAVQAVLGRKGESAVQAAFQGIEKGRELPVADRGLKLPQQGSDDKRWIISGNEACGLGALRGGVRFVAAYPITPASEILEWMAPRLEQTGGSLIQAEDELASINMIIGASFGGVASMTATSGPGLSLMMESLGLAVASETPVTVVNVMRGGPSTGIPTKSEQSDLFISLCGFHGDAPHLVLAPLNIADCVMSTQWAICLSESLQTVSIVLSDQSLGQSRLIMDAPEYPPIYCLRKLKQNPEDDYCRYQLTDDGISPMAVPGTPIGMYTADGLEHDQHGTPSSMAGDHKAQSLKREQKLREFDYGELWSEVQGDGDIVIITWGSASSACFEAGTKLSGQGIPVRVIGLRLLMPLQTKALIELIGNAKKVLVAEQNSGGQLYHYLLAEAATDTRSISFARPGPLALRPQQIIDKVQELIND